MNETVRWLLQNKLCCLRFFINQHVRLVLVLVLHTASSSINKYNCKHTHTHTRTYHEAYVYIIYIGICVNISFDQLKMNGKHWIWVLNWCCTLYTVETIGNNFVSFNRCYNTKTWEISDDVLKMWKEEDRNIRENVIFCTKNEEVNSVMWESPWTMMVKIKYEVEHFKI